MSKLLNSVLSLAGDKAAATAAAVADVCTAAERTILHGDKALFLDTADALGKAGGVTKAGELAKNKRGAVLGLLNAARSAALEQAGIIRPERKGAPTAEQKTAAAAAAAVIGETFAAGIAADEAERKAKASASADARKLTQQAKAGGVVSQGVESQPFTPAAAGDFAAMAAELIAAMNSGDAAAVAAVDSIVTAYTAKHINKAKGSKLTGKVVAVVKGKGSSKGKAVAVAA